MEDILRKMTEHAPWQVMLGLVSLFLLTKYAPDLFRFIEEYLPLRRRLIRLRQLIELNKQALEMLEIAAKNGISPDAQILRDIGKANHELMSEFFAIKNKLIGNKSQPISEVSKITKSFRAFPKHLFLIGTLGCAIPFWLMVILYSLVSKGSVEINFLSVSFIISMTLFSMIEGGGSAYKYWWKDNEPLKSKRYFLEPFVISGIANIVIGSMLIIPLLASKQ